ncbi:flagellar L-ring protein precursor FlgH [Robbsia andropogonis]|nr:flagellar basal body L-ring protein FlgH [Robbsia andropogonis]MCP1117848.1 flagellar basal body L-ring protein FlgH [Robbsia andropogonis]
MMKPRSHGFTAVPSRRAAGVVAWPTATVILMALSACGGQQSIVKVPTYPPLMNPQTQLAEQGGIYQPGTAMALYESPRARHVGDLLTVKLEENFQTSNSAQMDLNRDSNVTAKVADGRTTGIPITLSKLFNIGSANSKFQSKGSITGGGTLNGTLSVSVISVLPSGNLMVAGDRMIATNNDNQLVRFSGIVNPIDIQPGNLVSSTRVANARIEQQGDGALRTTTHSGWLHNQAANY